MSLCDSCTHSCYRPATWYDPPEYWCSANEDPYEEYDEELDEMVERCDYYSEYDEWDDGPDPDLAYEMARERELYGW